MIRLSKNVPDLKENIDRLKEESIDPEKEKELKEIIKMWEDSDKALQEDIQKFKSKLQEHDKTLSNIQKDSLALRKETEQVQTVASDLATQVSKNADKITNMEEEKNDLQNQLMSHDHKIQNLDGKQIEFDSSSKELAEEIRKTDAKVTQHIYNNESRLDGMEQSSKDMEDALKALNDKQGKTLLCEITCKMHVVKRFQTISTSECNTILSAYTLYSNCTHPTIYYITCLLFKQFIRA